VPRTPQRLCLARMLDRGAGGMILGLPETAEQRTRRPWCSSRVSGWLAGYEPDTHPTTQLPARSENLALHLVEEGGPRLSASLRPGDPLPRPTHHRCLWRGQMQSGEQKRAGSRKLRTRTATRGLTERTKANRSGWDPCWQLWAVGWPMDGSEADVTEWVWRRRSWAAAEPRPRGRRGVGMAGSSSGEPWRSERGRTAALRERGAPQGPRRDRRRRRGRQDRRRGRQGTGWTWRCSRGARRDRSAQRGNLLARNARCPAL
jgi:hypothetical protein